MFYALSTNSAWVNERVNLFVALAPIANMSNSTAVQPLSDILEPTWTALDAAGIYEVFRSKIKDETWLDSLTKAATSSP
jgi:hypothetical protein